MGDYILSLEHVIDKSQERHLPLSLTAKPQKSVTILGCQSQ
jgi:hypothetical protein